MRTAAVALLAASLTLPVAPAQSTDTSRQGAAQTGAIEFVVRITPSGGRAEPARRVPFLLLDKSFTEIQKEAEAAEPAVELEAFVDALEVTPELKAWIKRTGIVHFGSPEFSRSITPDDILAVPEFFQAYVAANASDVLVGFPKPKYRERDRTANPEKYERQRKEYLEQIRKRVETYPHTRDGIEVYLTDVNPGHRWVQQESERQRRLRDRALQQAYNRHRVARTETDLEGRGGFVGVPAGRYWLSTIETEALAGDMRLRWDLEVEVRPGETTRVELSNFNALRTERASR